MSNWLPLSVEECDANPFAQFQRWFDEALGLMADRTAIALVTSTLEGHAGARMVLLRHIDDHSFGWYTNYESRKGHELAINPHAALLWYNEPQGRQVRIEGAVEHMSGADSDAYFATRARGHQIGAHASHQSPWPAVANSRTGSRNSRPSSPGATCRDRPIGAAIA